MDKADRDVLDEFGEKVIREVRDDACHFIQRVISGQMQDRTSAQYFGEYERLDAASASVLHHFLAAAVDACLVRFLHFLEVNDIEVLYRKSTGPDRVNICAISDGLAGEIHNEQGWIARFSEFKDRIEPSAE